QGDSALTATIAVDRFLDGTIRGRDCEVGLKDASGYRHLITECDPLYLLDQRDFGKDRACESKHSARGVVAARGGDAGLHGRDGRSKGASDDRGARQLRCRRDGADDAWYVQQQ